MTSSEVILTDKLFHGIHGTEKIEKLKNVQLFPIDIHQKLFPLKIVKNGHIGISRNKRVGQLLRSPRMPAGNQYCKTKLILSTKNMAQKQKYISEKKQFLK